MKNEQRGSMPATLAVIVLVLIVAGIYYFYPKNKDILTVVNNTPKTSTYLDPEYGFGFSYPNDFKISSGNLICGFDDKDIVKQIGFNSTDSLDQNINPVFCVYVSKNKENYPVSTSIKVGNKEGRLISYSVAGSDNYKYEILLKNGEYLYIFVYRNYIIKQDLNDENRPVQYEHFMKISDEIISIINSFNFDK